MQAGNLDGFMPKPNNFNTLALEKLVSGKKGEEALAELRHSWTEQKK